ncbi:MAG: F0F1 ATP synthase subunit B [Peptostreptococcaceae bacterium]|nr:F0F1 ATP synthase subunit B [Peptostreptococcaceae bacterium]
MAGLIDVQLWTIIITICNMLVLFYFLKKKLFRPVREFMDKRAKEIEDSILEAEHKREQADRILKEYSTKIEEAQNEGRQIIEKARADAQIRADEMVELAKEESAKLKERAVKDIGSEREKALRSLKSEVADMAIMATRKLIDRSLDERSSRELIDEVIDEIGDERWSS